MCYGVLLCVVMSSALEVSLANILSVLPRGVAVCCSVLQCVAVCCSVLRCVVICPCLGRKGCQPLPRHVTLWFWYSRVCACAYVYVHVYVCVFARACRKFGVKSSPGT